MKQNGIVEQCFLQNVLNQNAGVQSYRYYIELKYIIIKVLKLVLYARLDCHDLFCVDGFKTDSDGRLGPGTVEFDYTGSFGTLVVEADRLGVSSCIT